MIPRTIVAIQSLVKTTELDTQNPETIESCGNLSVQLLRAFWSLFDGTWGVLLGLVVSSGIETALKGLRSLLAGVSDILKGTRSRKVGL